VFYTLSDFEKWQESGDAKGWTTKYYKGLGTSTSKEAKEYFQNMKVVNFERDDIEAILLEKEQKEKEENEKKQQETESQEDDNVSIVSKTTTASTTPSTPSTTSSTIKKATTRRKKIIITPQQKVNKIDLAFNDERADDRKDWLKHYKRNIVVDYNNPRLTLNEFVDKELIHFSNESNDRAIPHIMDGLKPSQRKVLFAAFKRNLTSEIKVAQLAGYTSENAAYHHGEVSLEGTIKKMAQNYIGSNNINLLEPIGQFGSRLLGGKDSAQSRYIFTCLTPNITRTIFRKEDDAMCRYLEDDGTPIEPECYYPILPMILVNGAQGLGTGYSTNVPMYNPLDIVKYIKAYICGQPTPKLVPWYRGFKGSITEISKNSYRTKGKYEIVDDVTIRITELPIDTWTEDYKEFLESCLIDNAPTVTPVKSDKGDKKATKKKEEKEKVGFIKSFVNRSTESEVCFEVKLNEEDLYDWVRDETKDGITELEKRLKLTSKISGTNMHLFNSEGQIQKYHSTDEIMEEWIKTRLDIMKRRREHVLMRLKYDADVIYWKVRFIKDFINGLIDIRNQRKADIESMLIEKEYPKFGENYDYLLKMDLYKLTKEEIEKLEQEAEQKKKDYETLEGKTAETIWTEELTGCNEMINVFNEHFMREYYQNAPVEKEVKNKKKTIKVNKV